MRTLKVMARIRFEGWVEVEREVPDDFCADNIDVAGTPEDKACADMVAEARESAVRPFARGRVGDALVTAQMFEVTP